MLAALLTACSPPPPTVPEVRPQVLASLPHDTTSFTEGLQRDGTTLWEGTGLAGMSELRELDPDTGALVRSAPLPGKLWGEGIAVTGDTIWQLTYQDGVALRWDKATLKVKKQVALTGEGWGLCYDGNRLVQSDGSATLRFRNPATFAQTGAVTVTLDGKPVPQLNELECAGGQVWANVWPTTQLVRINPASGRVTAKVDGGGLLTPEQAQGTDVMNGITWLGGDEYLVTGKYWPVMLRVRIVVPDG
ncbi:MAG TPA: glutaminyl-peptide cyclotransferase [Pseudonocardia sp.]|nr:glutaminyl-peptide cyclotransferase [Pseudonocardia sp.]